LHQQRAVFIWVAGFLKEKSNAPENLLILASCQFLKVLIPHCGLTPQFLTKKFP